MGNKVCAVVVVIVVERDMDANLIVYVEVNVSQSWISIQSLKSLRN